MFCLRSTNVSSGRLAVAALSLLLGFLPQGTSSAREQFAQDGASELASGQRTEAEIRYKKGVEAFRAKRYREAADEFEKADQLAPSAAYAYNVGLALDKLGDVGGALQAYRQYLKRRLNATNAAVVLARIERLEAKLAEQGLRQVTITSEPRGAEVSIDGAAVGVTPWTSEIPAGGHRIRIALKGYAPVVRKIDLNSTRARDLDFRLARTRSSSEARPAPRSNASQKKSPESG
jgi:tetratricopeptide (TPR) repeat protein